MSLIYSSHAAPSVAGIDIREPQSQNVLAQAALNEILARGAPLLGVDTSCTRSSPTCDWMRNFSDKTRLVEMNLPGTHDTATGNYSDETQASLIRYTGPIPAAKMFRCQERSILQMLNDGIRVFDLRVAYNPGNDTIGFHHSIALLAPQTTLSDVLFGIYNWLSNHPTEAILASINHESGTGTPYDPKFQELLYKALNDNGAAAGWWVQAKDTLGTLGQARGKLTLLQRFDYDMLPSTPQFSKRIGIHLGPSKWTDNGQSIELVYNDATGATAFIEDYYQPTLPADPAPTLASYIQAKFDVTTQHLLNATQLSQDQLYISFASAAYIASPEVTPRDFALGNGNDVSGINQRLLTWFKDPTRKGKRIGIVMLDFYDAVPGLIEALIKPGSGV
ncbi:PLC-like phosphodiesterase [Crucibulum laeve]|uniref:PLC-like phosphodiesterase n=1 Tax=Crucibulum laeve TaxID=68775 RepID=A0A5C3M593_9AGAR|nr:PLC-like phosphodiesterase [Crucibulum laeve]